MSSPFHLRDQIRFLEPIAGQICGCRSTEEKIGALSSLPTIKEKMGEYYLLKSREEFSEREYASLLALFTVGQEEVVHGYCTADRHTPEFALLLEQLVSIDRHYAPLGGIVGYHLTALRLIVSRKNEEKGNTRYAAPPTVDLPWDGEAVPSMIRWGIEALPLFAEIYPVGGAGDRLDLLDRGNGSRALPAALLPFLGRTLIEGLIRDVEAKEALYKNLTGKEVTTPILLMTSHEKENHKIVLQILRENNWFERGEEHFRFMTQPLLPVLTKEGRWACSEKFSLFLKPGGHGDLWKLMEETGGFDWLQSLGRTHAIVRQINNPIAATDYALLAFAGLGFRRKKAFGFASCPPKKGMAEGVNVLVEREEGSYSISNVEYTTCFAKESGKKYPANTNILFLDLEKVRSCVQGCPFPGQLMNMKAELLCQDGQGGLIPSLGGRIETTMQNIADRITSCEKGSDHPTFLTVHAREKTISVTKKAGRGEETPKRAYAQLQENFISLFREKCRVEVSKARIVCTPKLGPLWSVIAQKVSQGKIAPGSELVLDIAELDFSHFDLQGSLLIFEGRCSIREVRIRNKGVNWSATSSHWKGEVERLESCEIHIHPTSELCMERLTLVGNQKIVVPPKTKCVASERDGEVFLKMEPLVAPTWFWDYQFTGSDEILLKKGAVV